jgi:hypothetical protein
MNQEMAFIESNWTWNFSGPSNQLFHDDNQVVLQLKNDLDDMKTFLPIK